jgi:hypothetical protein
MHASITSKYKAKWKLANVSSSTVVISLTQAQKSSKTWFQLRMRRMNNTVLYLTFLPQSSNSNALLKSTSSIPNLMMSVQLLVRQFSTWNASNKAWLSLREPFTSKVVTWNRVDNCHKRSNCNFEVISWISRLLKRRQVYSERRTHGVKIHPPHIDLSSDRWEFLPLRIAHDLRNLQNVFTKSQLWPNERMKGNSPGLSIE